MSGAVELMRMLLVMRVSPQQRIHAMVRKPEALQIWHEHGRSETQQTDLKFFSTSPAAPGYATR